MKKNDRIWRFKIIFPKTNVIVTFVRKIKATEGSPYQKGDEHQQKNTQQHSYYNKSIR